MRPTDKPRQLYMSIWIVALQEGLSPIDNILYFLETWHNLVHDWKTWKFDPTYNTLFEDLTNGT